MRSFEAPGFPSFKTDESSSFSRQGVYKSGFATTQKAYENNVLPLFESLDRLEKMLEGGKEFVAGDKLTEADVRLFTTLVSSIFTLTTKGHIVWLFSCEVSS